MNPLVAQMSVGNKLLCYNKYGTGNKVLLAFHGFGNTALMYAPLAEVLPPDYTLYAFDFPFHGNTVTFEGILNNGDLLQIVRSCAAQHQENQVALIGYSIGAKAVLSIIAQQPALVRQFFLLAADGLVPNKVYNLLMNHAIGRWLFKQNLTYPFFLSFFVKALKTLKVLPEATVKLLLHFLKQDAHRLQLMLGWPALRGITAPISIIKAQISSTNLEGHIYMGAFDKVIPLKNASTFAAHLPSVSIHILQKGHKLLCHTSAKDIASRLL